MSQEQLAELIGVSRQCITKWESQSGYPEMQKVICLASCLDVSIDWLFESEISEQNEGYKPTNKENNLLAEIDKKIALHTMREKSVRQKLNVPRDGYNIETVPTGLESLDNKTYGLYRGFTYYILGAPAIGKLPFALSIVDNVLKRQGKVLMFLKDHLPERIYRTVIEISSEVSRATDDDLSVEEKTKIALAKELYIDSSFMLDDSYDESVEKMYEKSINLNEQLDLIVIDSGRFLYSNVSGHNKSFDYMKHIHRVIQNIATGCRCPVIVLDRLDEEVEKMVAEHAESGDIFKELVLNHSEYSLENVWIIQRDGYYKKPAGVNQPIRLLMKTLGYYEEFQSVDLQLKSRISKVCDL